MKHLSKICAAALLSVSLAACTTQQANPASAGNPKFTTGISAPEPVRR
ncbi:hypothetical protein [Phenylobacterium zucineum]